MARRQVREGLARSEAGAMEGASQRARAVHELFQERGSP